MKPQNDDREKSSKVHKVKSSVKIHHIFWVVFTTIIIFMFSNVYALEKDYQIKYCKGTIEFVLPDRTRVDCLTETHAIEYDFGKKWAESIGQSLHYAMWTGKKAGIVLIVNRNEERFYKRLKAVVDHYGLPIDVWTVIK